MAEYIHNAVNSSDVVNNGSGLRQGDTLVFNTSAGQFCHAGTPFRWTVPHDGLYSIEARGGASGVGDASFQNAACQVLLSRTYFKRGQELLMVIGQRSGDMYSSDYPVGGGGGTFVTKIVPSSPDVFKPLGVCVEPVVVAGGAPGQEDDPVPFDKNGCKYFHDRQNTDANPNTGTCHQATYAGGGFRGSKQGNSRVNGDSFLDGASGGIWSTDHSKGSGGYGGGGATSDPIGGGGGGYTGGAGTGGACESGASFLLSGHQYSTRIADLVPNTGTCKITYEAVLDPPTNLNIVKTGRLFHLTGVPNKPITQWQIDVYLNGTFKKKLTGNSAIPSSVELMSMEEFANDFRLGANVIKVNVSATTGTDLSLWFAHERTVSVDSRIPKVQWQDYTGTKLSKNCILLSPFVVSNCNFSFTEYKVEAIQGGVVKATSSVNGEATKSFDLQGCDPGVVQLKVTTKVRATGHNDGYGYDLIHEFTNDLTLDEIEDTKVKTSVDTCQPNDVIKVEWLPKYSGQYKYSLYHDDQVSEYINTSTAYEHPFIVPSVYTNTAKVAIKCANELVEYKPQFTKVFNITDMDWTTTTISFPNISCIVSGSCAQISVGINGLTKRVFSGGTTDNHTFPQGYFRKGKNIVSLTITDTKGGVLHKDLEVYLEVVNSDIQLGNRVGITSHHCFVDDTGVESFQEGNNTKSSILDLGILEKEYVHHTSNLPSNKVVQKIVVTKDSTDDCVYNPIKITGAIE